MTAAKVVRAMSLAATRPMELFDRLQAKAQVATDRLLHHEMRGPGMDLGQALARIDSCLAAGTALRLGEQSLLEIEMEVEEGIRNLRKHAAFPLGYNGDLGLAQFCYVVCRALRPEVVVETGVGYGVTSSFILKALAVNGRGILHSVDLPPIGEGAEELVGSLIQKSLASRWRFHRGASKRVLPGLLRQLDRVDLFLHDSLHTYANMLLELTTVEPHLSRPSVVVADDIGDHPAFARWAAQAAPDLWLAVKPSQKEGLFGVCVFAQRPRGLASHPRHPRHARRRHQLPRRHAPGGRVGTSRRVAVCLRGHRQ